MRSMRVTIEPDFLPGEVELFTDRGARVDVRSRVEGVWRAVYFVPAKRVTLGSIHYSAGISGRSVRGTLTFRTMAS
jgi:hypothetical protein